MVCSPRWDDVNGQTKRSTSITNIHRRFKHELVGSEIRLAYKMWTTYLLPLPTPPPPPANPGALRCIANPLQNRCLSCICPSEDKHSELEIRNLSRGLYGRHRVMKLGKQAFLIDVTIVGSIQTTCFFRGCANHPRFNRSATSPPSYYHSYSMAPAWIVARNSL